MVSNQALAVRGFLEKHRGEEWCDPCIEKYIDYTAQTTTKSLDQSPGYRVMRPGRCVNCGDTRKTTVYDGEP